MGPEICRRIDELAAISESPDHLTRIFLSAEQRLASELVLGWMRDSGMAAHIDAIGNIVGRYEGAQSDLPALVLGSHLDTVRDAGKYDGMLGVITAIACVAELNRAGRRLDFAITVVGFSDEEGVRFGTTMLGSEAVAGTFDLTRLERVDGSGLTMAQALRAYGLDPDRISEAAMRREDVLAYVELHIEQGPVLEGWGLPVGNVTAISGATRYEVTIGGEAGHAGTVPMTARKDALAAAAECIVAVETRCGGEPGLVGTVGRIEARPGAINVIPGSVIFTIDIRAPGDAQRSAAAEDVLRQLDTIAIRRGVTLDARKIYDMAATPCAPWLMAQIDEAISAEGITPFHLPSGAGHDGMAIAAIADIGMIFLRCAKGISHNPAEAITVEDAETGARVLLRFIEGFRTSA